jgi:hypothetical protein
MTTSSDRHDFAPASRDAGTPNRVIHTMRTLEGGTVMYRRSIIAGIVLPLAGVLTVGMSPTAHATGHGQGTHCLAEFDLTLSPGFSMTPSTGTFTSNGETGTITCDGPVNGKPVTGTGTRGEVGRYGLDGPNSCSKPDGTGDETFSLTVPTASGPQHVSDFATLTYGAFQGGGVLGGTLKSNRMYGTFNVTPMVGDCVTAPITKMHVRCDEWIVDAKSET